MATSEELKLLGGWASPFSIRVRIAFNLKEVINYKFIDVGFEKKDVIKFNPIYKRTPILIHNEKTICESMAIVQYIDEKWTDNNEYSILAKDPYDRATGYFWAVYVDEKLPPSFLVLLKRKEGDREQAVGDLTAALQQLENTFKHCSKGKDFFFGENIGYLDIALGCYLGWIEAVEKMEDICILDESVTPLLTKWAARFCCDEAVMKVMPKADELIEFHKKHMTTVN